MLTCQGPGVRLAVSWLLAEGVFYLCLAGSRMYFSKFCLFFILRQGLTALPGQALNSPGLKQPCFLLLSIWDDRCATMLDWGW